MLNVDMRLAQRFVRWCARGTDYTKMPHACFKIFLGSEASAAREFSRIFKRHLRARFDFVWTVGFNWAAKAALREWFLFNLWPSGRDPRELVLAIHPGRQSRTPNHCMPGDSPVPNRNTGHYRSLVATSPRL
jgi:hypothetical protein